MRKHLALMSALTTSAAVVAVVLPASAADQTVSVGTPHNRFSPATVTITAGDTVTWNNVTGDHNVRFDVGSYVMPASPSTDTWTVSRTFNTPGTFTYYCEVHVDEGMRGTVVVNPAPGTPPPANPGPAPPSGGGGGGGGGGGPAPQPPAGPAPAPVVSHFGMTRSRFRVGPGATARSAARARRGSAFQFRLSRPATVRIALSRILAGHGGKKRYTAEGTLARRDRRAGANTVPFTGRVGRGALATGFYRATITATGANGKRSKPKHTSFRIVFH